MRLTKLAASGAWSAILQWSRVGLNAVIFLVLSRWLSLTEIGAVAAAQAPIMFLQQVLTAVVPDAVVQRRSASQAWLSTVLWLSLAIGGATSVFLAAVAESLAGAIGQPSVAAFLLVLAPCPLLYAVGGVPDGLLRKDLETRRLAARTTVSTLITGSLAIALGYLGYGAWSLVLFTLVNAVLSTALLFVVSPWRPSRMFERPEVPDILRTMLSLAGRYALSAAVFPALALAITNGLGARAAGIFQVAQRTYTMMDSLTVTPVRFLALPLFSRVQHDRELLNIRLAKALSLSAVLSAPAYLGLFAVSRDLLPLLIGPENGLPAVPVLMALCLYGPFGLAIGLISHALTSVGLAGVVFRRTLLMLVYALLPCLIAAQYDVLWVAVAYSLCSGFVGSLIAIGIARRTLGTPVGAVFAAALPPAVAGGLMAGAVLLIANQLADLAAPFRLAVSIAAGGAIYLLVLAVIARPHLRTLLSMVTSRKAPPAADSPKEAQ